MINTAAKNSFWEVVKQCLMRFHGFPEHKAEKKMMELRERLEKPPVGMSSEMVYHSEPYYVACNIAQKERDISEDREVYEQILNKYNW